MKLLTPKEVQAFHDDDGTVVDQYLEGINRQFRESDSDRYGWYKIDLRFTDEYELKKFTKGNRLALLKVAIEEAGWYLDKEHTTLSLYREHNVYAWRAEIRARDLSDEVEHDPDL